MSSIGHNLTMMIQSYTAEDHSYTPSEREALARQLIEDSNIDNYPKYEEALFALHGYIVNLRKTYFKARDAEELLSIQRRERLAIDLLAFLKNVSPGDIEIGEVIIPAPPGKYI